MGAPQVEVSGVPRPVLRAVGPGVPSARELVDIRHQWDADVVIDAAGTTATSGLTATPWDDVVRATAGAPVTGTPAGGAAAARP